jgi:hypothetical protein
MTMPTATKEKTGALAELERLERERDTAHAEARAKREPLTKWERDHFGLPAVQKPADLEATWVEGRDRFHAADTAVRQFAVRNAGAVIGESLPDREQVMADVVQKYTDLRAAIGRARGLEHRMLEVLARVGLSGQDMAADRRLDQLASALDPFDDLDTITAPYSRSAETPEGHLPLLRPNENEDGWISWKAVS